MPVFRGLVGPIPEGRSVMRQIRAPEVFEEAADEGMGRGPCHKKEASSESQGRNDDRGGRLIAAIAP